MKLVIDIPKRVYDYIIKKGYIVNSDRLEVAESIINGAPLPKGHGDLIDKSKLKVHYVGTDIGTDCPVYLLPTVDEAQPIIKADKEAKK